MKYLWRLGSRLFEMFFLNQSHHRLVLYDKLERLVVSWLRQLHVPSTQTSWQRIHDLNFLSVACGAKIRSSQDKARSVLWKHGTFWVIINLNHCFDTKMWFVQPAERARRKCEPKVWWKSRTGVWNCFVAKVFGEEIFACSHVFLLLVCLFVQQLNCKIA